MTSEQQAVRATEEHSRVAARKCGCDIMVDPQGVTWLRNNGACVYHLCRLCGDVPVADSEPDCLCPKCWEDVRDAGVP